MDVSGTVAGAHSSLSARVCETYSGDSYRASDRTTSTALGVLGLRFRIRVRLQRKPNLDVPLSQLGMAAVKISKVRQLCVQQVYVAMRKVWQTTK